MNTERAFVACLVVALAFVMTAMPARAATCGGVLNPVIVAATPVSFGLYSPGAASAVTVNGTVTVSCNVVVGNTLPSFAVALSAGTASSFSPRQMAFGGARLNYNLYTTAAATTIWGDGTGGSATQSYDSGAARGLTTFTAYGAVPAGQYVATGLYADTITVTVTY